MHKITITQSELTLWVIIFCSASALRMTVPFSARGNIYDIVEHFTEIGKLRTFILYSIIVLILIEIEPIIPPIVADMA